MQGTNLGGGTLRTFQYYRQGQSVQTLGILQEYIHSPMVLKQCFIEHASWEETYSQEFPNFPETETVKLFTMTRVLFLHYRVGWYCRIVMVLCHLGHQPSSVLVTRQKGTSNKKNNNQQLSMQQFTSRQQHTLSRHTHTHTHTHICIINTHWRLRKQAIHSKKAEVDTQLQTSAKTHIQTQAQGKMNTESFSCFHKV